ncbi:MAG: hypothetical protein Q4E24_13815 [bacterium]|nr:hypothetical protein [bacterium]
MMKKRAMNYIKNYYGYQMKGDTKHGREQIDWGISSDWDSSDD